jgi:2,3-bisphosphoglycerate-dependent phosphoglycerate mutase
MRINVYLIRHGEAASNIDPLFKGENALTDLGHKQALDLSKYLEKIRVKKIYSSPSLRSKQTADETCRVKKLDKNILDFIDERKVVYINDKEYENGENFTDFIERIKKTRVLFENEQETHIAVFSHAIFIKGFIAHVMLKDKLTDDLFSVMSQKIAIDHARISKFVYNSEKAKWHISLINSVKA